MARLLHPATAAKKTNRIFSFGLEGISLQGNKEKEFVRSRKEFLEHFLRRLAQKPFLWQSEEVRVFCQSNSIDFEKTLKSLPKPNYTAQCTKYRNTFHALSGKEINPEIITKIQNFLGFLKKMLGVVKVISRQACLRNLRKQNYKGMVGKTQNQFKNNAYMSKELLVKFLPDFEYNLIPKADCLFPLGYQDPSFSESMNKVIGLSVSNPAQEYYSLLKRELYDIEAFLEVFATREHFELNRVKLQAKLKWDQIESQRLSASPEQKTGGFLGFNKVDKGVKINELSESIKEVTFGLWTLFLMDRQAGKAVHSCETHKMHWLSSLLL
jgi:PX domain